jgi:hypothetical protein
MTYDPNDRRNRLERRGMGTGTMAGIALVVALFAGMIIWAMNSNDRQTASSPNTPSTTTGQSTQPNAPVNPPARTPAPAPQSK